MNNPMAGTDPTGYCATDDQMGDCVDGLEEGVPQAITNAEGETVGHIGKDSNGNVHISNGSSDGLKAVANSIWDVGKASGTNVNQSSTDNLEVTGGDSSKITTKTKRRKVKTIRSADGENEEDFLTRLSRVNNKATL
jgi:hypothetical protein